MSTTATATHANMEAHAKRWRVGTAAPALRDTTEITATNTFVEAHISHVCITYRCSVKNFSMIILERSSVGICLFCEGLVLLLWNFMRLLLLCCFPVRVDLLVHCWPQSGTAGGHFGEPCNFPHFFGLLRTLSRPISCCFLSVLLHVIALARLLDCGCY